MLVMGKFNNRKFYKIRETISLFGMVVIFLISESGIEIGIEMVEVKLGNLTIFYFSFNVNQYFCI